MSPPHESRGTVVTYSCRACRAHERATLHELARRLAALKGYDFAEEYNGARRYPGHLYFVPNDTLVGIDTAQKLGIRNEQDLFGGVVPFGFAATKTITHALPAADSRSPEGWSREFTRNVRDVVLPGYSAFTRCDARSAGARLLKLGRVRIKLPAGIGGLGQVVVDDARTLDAQLKSLDDDALWRDGLVLEQDLTDVVTHSVGQVSVDEMRASYCGMQRLTTNHHGAQVYGGSDLIVARGGFERLKELVLVPEVKIAVDQARAYHTAAMTSFPDMFASRCNYDIAQGVDKTGQWRSGVLEQSWRMGGASAAEVAALEAFHANESLDVVRAATTEVYATDSVPADAVVYFRGIDEHAGAMTKYVRIAPYANP
ncbi:MAG TPA: DUF3182 family protein [Burkholderiales bacterium]|jgi:hypothetical protein|nr:DUF3182 family protein [Burkholderiales bacterium]